MASASAAVRIWIGAPGSLASRGQGPWASTAPASGSASSPAAVAAFPEESAGAWESSDALDGTALASATVLEATGRGRRGVARSACGSFRDTMSRHETSAQAPALRLPSSGTFPPRLQIHAKEYSSAGIRDNTYRAGEIGARM